MIMAVFYYVKCIQWADKVAVAFNFINIHGRKAFYVQIGATQLSGCLDNSVLQTCTIQNPITQRGKKM